MVHSCNIYCYSMEAGEASSLGMKDNGKWMPFMFDMDIVDAVKLTSDEEEDFTYNCTTIYTADDNHYVIDTPYSVFSRMFKKYRSFMDLDLSDDGEGNSSPDDLDL